MKKKVAKPDLDMERLYVANIHSFIDDFKSMGVSITVQAEWGGNRGAVFSSMTKEGALDWLLQAELVARNGDSGDNFDSLIASIETRLGRLKRCYDAAGRHTPPAPASTSKRKGKKKK